MKIIQATTIGIGVVCLLAALVFAPVWLTPIAKSWFKRDFAESVSSALQTIPDSQQPCIYDDTLDIYVTSIDQLNVDKMVEQAVAYHTPLFVPRDSHRDPHFRVFANGNTYYWSFFRQELVAFQGDRFSLRGHAEEACEAYNASSEILEQDYWERHKIRVSVENFCCFAPSHPQH